MVRRGGFTGGGIGIGGLGGSGIGPVVCTLDGKPRPVVAGLRCHRVLVYEPRPRAAGLERYVHRVPIAEVDSGQRLAASAGVVGRGGLRVRRDRAVGLRRRGCAKRRGPGRDRSPAGPAEGGRRGASGRRPARHHRLRHAGRVPRPRRWENRPTSKTPGGCSKRSAGASTGSTAGCACGGNPGRDRSSASRRRCYGWTRWTTPRSRRYLRGSQWEGKAGAFGYQDGLDWVHVVAAASRTSSACPWNSWPRCSPRRAFRSFPSGPSGPGP